MCRWMNRIDRLMTSWMNGGWMNGMDEWMDDRMDGWMEDG